MTVNVLALNTELVNGLGEIDLGEGLIISFEDTIEYRDNGDGLIISFEDSVVNSVSSYAIIQFEDTVHDASVSTFLSRNGYYPIFTINGARVPDNQLTGKLTYEHTEDNSALLEFSIIPPLGVQNIFKYQGSTVTCDIQTDDGIYRIFTGFIDIPEIDVMGERITFMCSDNRDEHLMNGDAGASTLYGQYSNTIFGVASNLKDEMLARISTVPYSLDWDGYGNPHFTSWTPKVTPDYTFINSDVYRTEPTIRFESRAKITNYITIDFNYSYQRFHQDNVSYTWSIPYDTAYFLTAGPSLCSKEMVRQAISNTDWTLINDIGFTEILPSGFYNVNGVKIAWSTTQVSGTMVAQTNTNPIPGGDPIPVLDANGNQVYTAVATSSTDLADLFCFGAQWSMGKRYSQNIQEQYTITISAPQSIAQYGTITANSSYKLADIDNGAAWDQSKATGTAFYSDQTLSLSEFNTATVTAINKAKTDILRAHRDTRVTFDIFVRPELDLKHTIELVTTRIQCKGKISAIRHSCSLDFEDNTGGFTTVELALFRATGSQAETTITPPTRPTDTYSASTSAIGLGSHYGEDPTNHPEWNGHIGNAYITVQDGAYLDTRKTDYTESFVVDTPAISDSSRLQRTLIASQSYNIQIPNNNLIWTTVGK